jgi:DNA-binding protein YbaB
VKETTRIESAKSQQSIALAKSRELALQTPGIERCVTWEGYLENGKECSIATTPDSSTVSSSSVINSLASDTSTILSIPDSSTSGSESVTVTIKGDNEYKNTSIEIDAVSFKGKFEEIISLASKLESSKTISADISKNFQKLGQLRSKTYSSSVKLPNAKYSDEKIKTTTPSVCKVEGISILRLAKGNCEISYTLESESGNEYSSNRSWVFK